MLKYDEEWKQNLYCLILSDLLRNLDSLNVNNTSQKLGGNWPTEKEIKSYVCYYDELLQIKTL